MSFIFPITILRTHCSTTAELATLQDALTPLGAQPEPVEPAGRDLIEDALVDVEPSPDVHHKAATLQVLDSLVHLLREALKPYSGGRITRGKVLDTGPVAAILVGCNQESASHLFDTVSHAHPPPNILRHQDRDSRLLEVILAALL